MKPIKWLSAPEDHDYPAALSYLMLLVPQTDAETAVINLRAAPMSYFKAKDICRAARLPILGVENSHVAKNLNKISVGKSLSPILLVRRTDGCRVEIVDGYHRVCAVECYDEDTPIPCKIA
jgi:hypothetical protein